MSFEQTRTQQSMSPAAADKFLFHRCQRLENRIQKVTNSSRVEARPVKNRKRQKLQRTKSEREQIAK